jgi:hypothetical protein
MNDKMARLKQLVLNNKEDFGESVADSLIDMMNYSTIGLMVLEGTWGD